MIRKGCRVGYCKLAGLRVLWDVIVYTINGIWYANNIVHLMPEIKII